MYISPIKPSRFSSQFFEQIQELIYKGVVKTGQQIPPERNLAASMEVSRRSVRMAIDKLINIGLLKQVPGLRVPLVPLRPGWKIHSPFRWTQEATFFGLLEVRMGLECNTAKLAHILYAQESILKNTTSL